MYPSQEVTGREPRLVLPEMGLCLFQKVTGREPKLVLPEMGLCPSQEVTGRKEDSGWAFLRWDFVLPKRSQEGN